MTKSAEEQPPSLWQHEAYAVPVNRHDQAIRRERRSAWEYLTHEDCDDKRSADHIAVPGYN